MIKMYHIKTAEMKNLLFVVASLFVVIFFGGCTGGKTEKTGTEGQSTDIPVNDSLPKVWTKIEATDIKDNPVKLFGQDWLALAVGNEKEANAMTVGWGGLGTLWQLDNPVVTVYIRDDRYTRELLDKNDYFTLTAFPKAHRKALNYFGTHSGRDTDKMKASGLTVRFTELGNPLFEEGRLVLECHRIYNAPFSAAGIGTPRGNTPKDGYGERFIIYIGEIVNVWEKQ